MPTFKRFDPSDLHRLLLGATEHKRRVDKTVSDDGWVAAQALFCPYYATLEGTLGSDWGVILNPESVKFTCLVFEHEWCGCPSTQGPHGEWFADHGGGNQEPDQWAVPPSRRRTHRAIERRRRNRVG